MDGRLPGTVPATVPAMATVTADPVAEVTDLLQHLIRNACVNDGTADPGTRPAARTCWQDTSTAPGSTSTRYEPAPGRASLVARIEGRDPDAPTLLLMGHTDVVPANADRWRHDPFGGELVDGEVWGRGAIDMLNLTASMAVATRRLAASGFRPEGTLIYLAVADEEALGTWGADHLTRSRARRRGRRLRHHRVRRHPARGRRRRRAAAGDGRREGLLLVHAAHRRARPATPRSRTRTDNALVKAAEVVRRLADYRPATRIHDAWRRFVVGLGLPEELSRAAARPDTFLDAAGHAAHRHGPPVPRLHPHDHRPDRRPRRHQDQRHPRHRRRRARHPHAARPDAARRPGHARRRARRPGRPRRR